MRSYRRFPLLVPVLLCALAVLAARPTEEPRHGPHQAGGGGVGAEVARLYEEAAVAAQEYEEGRREAELQRSRAQRYEELLERERREAAVLREDLGRIARAQYRTGGDVPITARLILTDDPEELMHGQHAVWQADLAVNNAIGKSSRAQARLAEDEEKAEAAWKALEKRNTELVELKQRIERKLERARGRLQGQANDSAAAGTCRGAVRLDRPKAVRVSLPPPWVAPVETYEMSAEFGSGGSHWARRHTGQDFAVPIGTPVRAVGEGTVMKVSCGGAFGIQILIAHPEGYYTHYAHLASVAVDQGDRVGPGQWIGQAGTTGNSTGPHLHFEVRVTPQLGSGVDPVPWLAARGVHL
ncbi:peptidase M23 [Streptomyces sp. AS58]|uniref:M23 family peptidase n=1 Tax=Streptomyces cadmiisoli TaxID=2184053 RepID=A0A2Z4J0Z8_9ACTN|nr:MULTISPECIES: M23 family metallopeptidase [Streptomyces]AWW38677.1 M23 family peptidase [Streptomyces cadmiisoli]KOV65645.1 peptidase M23 [Streptomyces sp. AS58]